MNESIIKSKDFPFDEAVYKSRIEKAKLCSTYSDFVLSVENDEEERLKFIKRRELYRLGNVPALQNILYATLYGSRDSHISISRYANCEVRIGFQPSTFPTPPPPNYGARSTKGLTKNARSKIRAGVDYISKGNKQTLAFITLSYSDDALPACHKTCKSQLSTFFKALKRHSPNVLYVWVAEIQPQRLKKSGTSAIHFHIAINKFICCNWLRKTWRRITRCQKALPNVIKVYKPAHYMSKYLCKGSSIDEGETSGQIHWIGGDRYGMSHKVSKGLKPTETMLLKGSYDDFNELIKANGFHRNTNWCSDYALSLSVNTSTPLKNLTKCQA